MTAGKPGRAPIHLSLAQIARYINIPIPEAAKNLNVCVSILKRLCRDYGMRRWPFRKIRSVQEKMAVFRRTSIDSPSGKLAQSIASLRLLRETVLKEIPVTPIDDLLYRQTVALNSTRPTVNTAATGRWPSGAQDGLSVQSAAAGGDQDLKGLGAQRKPTSLSAPFPPGEQGVAHVLTEREVAFLKARFAEFGGKMTLSSAQAMLLHAQPAQAPQPPMQQMAQMQPMPMQQVSMQQVPMQQVPMQQYALVPMPVDMQQLRLQQQQQLQLFVQQQQQQHQQLQQQQFQQQQFQQHQQQQQQQMQQAQFPQVVGNGGR
eukprot:TRINITY_DN836_c5_g1_i1.p1 TRINITY_DN836_c5_g1~~TRINITY_DN836_c5_g1_i1.p1  ORF type:complete len:333 (+),score=65.66 TRINITY_DN836_c5_g1_i1:53-1000(+)